MTTIVAEVVNIPLGPGTLKIGETGSDIDISCLVNNAVLTPGKEEGDSTTKLCGTTVPGSVSYTYTLSGNVDLDIATDTGFFALTQAMAGESVPFSFTPNSEAATTATGDLILDPLPFGGEESGQRMAADFEFSVVDKPTYSFGTAAVSAESDYDETE